MNVHSSSRPMSQPQIDSSNADRRSQILEAALVCFAKRGFHQTSMHDISGEAGISVGLIYRYFENKEAVISAMADRHKKEIQRDARTRAPGADVCSNRSRSCSPRIAAKTHRKLSPRSWSIFTPKRRAIRTWPIWCAMFWKRRWTA